MGQPTGALPEPHSVYVRKQAKYLYVCYAFDLKLEFYSHRTHGVCGQIQTMFMESEWSNYTLKVWSIFISYMNWSTVLLEKCRYITINNKIVVFIFEWPPNPANIILYPIFACYTKPFTIYKYKYVYIFLNSGTKNSNKLDI